MEILRTSQRLTALLCSMVLMAGCSDSDPGPALPEIRMWLSSLKSSPPMPVEGCTSISNPNLESSEAQRAFPCLNSRHADSCAGMVVS